MNISSLIFFFAIVLTVFAYNPCHQQQYASYAECDRYCTNGCEYGCGGSTCYTEGGICQQHGFFGGICFCQGDANACGA